MEIVNQSQRDLIKELNTLSKRANQRILKIERLTGRKSPQYAVKELADYLSVSQGLTKRRGKSIRASQYKKSMTETEVIANKKALERFLYDDMSRVSSIKQYTLKMSTEAGKKLSPAQANKFYQAQQSWKWIFQHVNESDFWDYYNIIFSNEVPSYKDFVTDIEEYLWPNSELPIDENLKSQLRGVYDYLKKGE